MTRKAERRARVSGWLAIVGTGAVLAIAAALMAGAWAAIAIVLAALAIGHRRMMAPQGVAILTYHSVSAHPGWLPWSREIATHPATFARHMATLAAMRVRVIGTRRLLALRDAGMPPPPGCVVLHLDDGYLDNWLNAWPILKRHGFAATIFPSLDFVEPGDVVRTAGPDTGYCNWAELAAIEHGTLIEVEPHGVGHARVPTGDGAVDRLTAANWRRHAWLQWAAMPGPKHDWHRHELPPAVPLGSVVPPSGLALAERAWRDGVQEPQAALEARITHDLTVCRSAFADRLGIVPTLFCWPENKVGEAGRRIATTLGYRATTAGNGRNAPGEPADILSRIHMGDRALGIRWLFAEGWHLRASVRLMQGNHYWYLLLAPMHVVRRVVMTGRARFGGPFA